MTENPHKPAETVKTAARSQTPRIKIAANGHGGAGRSAPREGPPGEAGDADRSAAARKPAEAEQTAPEEHAAESAAPLAATQTAIRIDEFDAWYNEFQALRGISMNIPKQRVTAFIGPSGCGKTTLLRWINRMNDTVPDARATGTLQLGDLDVLSPRTDVVDLRRRVGIVFQKPNPFPKSIYENVAFGPRLHYKISRSELEQIVEWSLRKAAVWDEVKDRLKQSALGLSGGQQQRLCIARAIAVGPEVLLMDEPCSALDPRSTMAIEDLMAELREDYTIVIVTHNMQQAARSSDFTGFLYQGDLVEFGSTQDLFTRPRQQETENYITGRFG